MLTLMEHLTMLLRQSERGVERGRRQGRPQGEQTSTPAHYSVDGDEASAPRTQERDATPNRPHQPGELATGGRPRPAALVGRLLETRAKQTSPALPKDGN